MTMRSWALAEEEITNQLRLNFYKHLREVLEDDDSKPETGGKVSQWIAKLSEYICSKEELKHLLQYVVPYQRNTLFSSLVFQWLEIDCYVRMRSVGVDALSAIASCSIAALLCITFPSNRAWEYPPTRLRFPSLDVKDPLQHFLHCETLFTVGLCIFSALGYHRSLVVDLRKAAREKANAIALSRTRHLFVSGVMCPCRLEVRGIESIVESTVCHQSLSTGDAIRLLHLLEAVDETCTSILESDFITTLVNDLLTCEPENDLVHHWKLFKFLLIQKPKFQSCGLPNKSYDLLEWRGPLNLDILLEICNIYANRTSPSTTLTSAMNCGIAIEAYVKYHSWNVKGTQELIVNHLRTLIGMFISCKSCDMSKERMEIFDLLRRLIPILLTPSIESAKIRPILRKVFLTCLIHQPLLHEVMVWLRVIVMVPSDLIDTIYLLSQCTLGPYSETFVRELWCFLHACKEFMLQVQFEAMERETKRWLLSMCHMSFSLYQDSDGPEGIIDLIESIKSWLKSTVLTVRCVLKRPRQE